jgi:hypothetical protein
MINGGLMNDDRRWLERKKLMPDASVVRGPGQAKESPSLSDIVPRKVYEVARRATVFTAAARGS